MCPWKQGISCHIDGENSNNDNFQTINNMPGKMPGPLGHVILNSYKNTFSQVDMSPFYRIGSCRCLGCVVLAWLQWTGWEGAEGQQSHTPEEVLTACFPD